jgi:hypothetical protein
MNIDDLEILQRLNKDYPILFLRNNIDKIISKTPNQNTFNITNTSKLLNLSRKDTKSLIENIKNRAKEYDK